MANKGTRRKKSKKGGFSPANPSSYSDAASYALKTFGNANMQYKNVFGPGADNNSSNSLRTLTGQMAGKKRSMRKGGNRHSKTAKKGGGMWGHVLNQLLPVAALVGLNYSSKNRRRGSKRHSYVY